MSKLISILAFICCLINNGEAQDCNVLVSITSSDTVVLVDTSISRSCLQCVDGNMVFASNTEWVIDRDRVTDSTPGVEVVVGVLVLLDPMQLLMDGSVTLECTDTISLVYTNIEVFSSTPVPPVIRPPALTVDEGGTARAACSDPNPSQLMIEVQWLDPHGNIIAPGNDEFITIPNITRTQAGQYRCVLTSITSDTVSTTLPITVQYSPDVTSQDPTLVQALPGTNVTLSCDFTGVPPPDVTWSHDGVVTASGQDVAIVTTGNRSEYTVQGVTGERGCVYRCSVSNIVGSGSLNFTVQTAPDPATTLITSTSETSISLNWSYQSDGSSPRTGVEVELRSGADIVSSVMVGPAQVSTTFSSLQPLTNYSLTVYVRNAVGSSAPATVHTSTLSLRLPRPTISIFQPTSSSELFVQWEGATIVTCTTAPPTGWSVELSRSGEVVEVVSQDGPDNTTASLRGLQSGTQYTVRVAGVNTRGLGNFSNPVTTSTTSSSGNTLTVLEAVIVILVVLLIIAILAIIAGCLYRRCLKHPQQESLTPCAAYGVCTVKGPADYVMSTTNPGGDPAGHDTADTTVNFTEPEYQTIPEFHREN